MVLNKVRYVYNFIELPLTITPIFINITLYMDNTRPIIKLDIIYLSKTFQIIWFFIIIAYINSKCKNILIYWKIPCK